MFTNTQIIPNGNSCVAYVHLHTQDTSDNSWMLGVVRSYDEQTNTYNVDDIDNSNGTEPYFNIPAKNVVPFPQRNRAYKRGQSILTVWYDVESSQFNTVLYPAVVIKDYPDPENPESVVLEVKYADDMDKTTLIYAIWAIPHP